MAEMNYRDQFRKHYKESDTRTLENEFAGIGTSAVNALKRAYSELDELAEPCANCDDEREKRAYNNQVGRIIDNLLREVRVTNGRRTVYQVRMHAHFKRKVAEVKDIVKEKTRERTQEASD